MAPKFTKILVVSKDEQRKINYRKWIEQNSRNNPQKFSISVKNSFRNNEEDKFDFIVLELEGSDSYIENGINKLLSSDIQIPCLLIIERTAPNKLITLFKQDNLPYIIPMEWMDYGLFNVVFQRMLDDQEQKSRIEEQLRVNESLLRNLPGLTFRCVNDKQWTMKYISDGCAKLTGYTKTDLIDNSTVSFNDLIHPDDQKDVWDSVQQAISKNEQYKITYRLIDARGDQHWVWELGNVFQSLDTQEWLLEGFITDITDRVKKQEELSRSQVKLQSIYNTAPVGLGILEQNTIVEINDFLCDLLGYQRSELLSSEIKKIFLSIDDFTEICRDIVAKKDGQTFCSIHTKLKRKDDRALDVILTISLIQNDENLLSFAVLDFSRQIELGIMLEESEAKSQSIIDHMHEGIVLTDENGIVIEWNSAMALLLPIARDDAIGKSFLGLMSDIEQKGIFRGSTIGEQKFLEEIYAKGIDQSTGKTWEGEVLNPQGNFRFYHADFFTVKIPKGNRLAVIVRDIDDQKRHEKELQFLVELSAVIRNHSNDLLAIRSSVLDIIVNLLGLESIALAMFNDNSDLGNIVEVRGIPTERIGNPVSWQNCVSQQAVYDESIYSICTECSRQLFEVDVNSTSEMEGISIPLSFGNNRIGIMFLFHPNGFTNYDYSLLKSLSNIVASALSQAILFQHTELRLKRLESLHVIDQAISGLFDLDLTNRIILDQAKQQLEADAGDILVLNLATNMMEYSASFGLKQLDMDEKRIHLSRSIAGRVLLSREPSVVPHVDDIELPFIMNHLRRHEIQAYFAYPIVAKGEPKGVIEIYMQRPFTPDTEWLDFLQALATQAGIAIDNIQLFEKMRQFQYKL